MTIYKAWASRCHNVFTLGLFTEKIIAQATLDLYRYKYSEKDTHHYGFDSGISEMTVHDDIPDALLKLPRQKVK